jgi:cobalamin biosynthesis Mg chelatase CobN
MHANILSLLQSFTGPFDNPYKNTTSRTKACFSPDGQFIAAADASGKIFIWKTDNGGKLETVLEDKSHLLKKKPTVSSALSNGASNNGSSNNGSNISGSSGSGSFPQHRSSFSISSSQSSSSSSNSNSSMLSPHSASSSSPSSSSSSAASSMKRGSLNAGVEVDKEKELNTVREFNTVYYTWMLFSSIAIMMMSIDCVLYSH